MHHTFMHAHTPTHNLWLWPKRPPLAFFVAETSVAEMSGPKRPTFIFQYYVTHDVSVYAIRRRNGY